MSDSTPDVIKIHDLRPAPGAKTAKKRVGDESVREDRPEVRGMIKTVSHLVAVEEVE